MADEKKEVLIVGDGPKAVRAALAQLALENPPNAKEIKESLAERWLAYWKKPIDTNCTSTRQIDREMALEDATESLAKTLKGYNSGPFYPEGMTRRRFRSIARDKAKLQVRDAFIAREEAKLVRSPSQQST